MYNTEIFDALGVKPAETFDELVELARTIGEKAPAAGFPDTYGIGARGARQWATIHPGFMTQYSREGGKDFELQGDALVPVMNSDVAVAFTDKWAAMLRDAGPPNWTNYYWYDVGTDLGAGKAAMIYDADILGYFNNTGTGSRRQDRLASGTEGTRRLAADQPVDLVTRHERRVTEQERGLALPAVGNREGSPAQGGDRTDEMIDPVRASIVEDPEFIDKMSTQKNFLETFNTVIEDSKILFTPQPAFFEATTLWAEALQNIYGGADAKETLDALVEEIQATVE